ncbi:MAG: stage III sporulation protein AF [Acutalibacteraceae bacterium]
MDALKSWAVSLIAAAAAGTFAMIVSPRGSMDKTIRAVVGIFVVAAIFSPLTELKKDGKNFFEKKAFAFEEENEADENLNEYMLSACKNAVNSEIEKAADELNIPAFQSEINAYVDEENCIIIHNITINIPAEHIDKAEKLSGRVSERIGAPVTVNAE